MPFKAINNIKNAIDLNYMSSINYKYANICNKVYFEV